MMDVVERGQGVELVNSACGADAGADEGANINMAAAGSSAAYAAPEALAKTR